MKKIRAAWASLWGDSDRRVRMGRVLGLFFITAGFVFIFFAWNGAASKNFIQGQFPYILSGGATGIALVVLGSLLLFLATVRAERELMTEKLDEVVRLLGRNLAGLQFSSSNGGSELATKVVAASSHYHRGECRILQGKDGLITVSLEQAINEGLQPCRVCDPPKVPEQEVGAGNGTGVAATRTTEASGTPNR
ncbi:MAG: hypothetical protein ACRDKT_11290 [Actinomycetota bacterium]